MDSAAAVGSIPHRGKLALHGRASIFICRDVRVYPHGYTRVTVYTPMDDVIVSLCRPAVHVSIAHTVSGHCAVCNVRAGRIVVQETKTTRVSL